MTNKDKRPPNYFDPVEELLSAIEKAKRRQGYSDKEGGRQNPSNYKQICEGWAKKGGWLLREAANLLSRCSPIRPHDLPGETHVQLNEEIDKVYKHMLAHAGKDLPLIDQNATSESAYQVRPITLIQWAAKHDYQIPWELYVEIIEPITRKTDRQREHAQTENAPQASKPARKNVGTSADSYSTRLLDIQKAAIDKFWVKFDSKRPPSTEEVVGWLMEKYETSKRAAIAIDLIIRSDERKGGGIIQRRPKK